MPDAQRWGLGIAFYVRYDKFANRFDKIQRIPYNVASSKL